MLKRLVAEQSPNKLVLKNIASGNFCALSDGSMQSLCQREEHDRSGGVPTAESATRHIAPLIKTILRIFAIDGRVEIEFVLVYNSL